MESEDQSMSSPNNILNCVE